MSVLLSTPRRLAGLRSNRYRARLCDPLGRIRGRQTGRFVRDIHRLPLVEIGRPERDAGGFVIIFMNIIFEKLGVD